MQTIHHSIRYFAHRNPESNAIAAPGRTPLSYRCLLEIIEQTSLALNASGLGRNDPLAIVLPEGAEMVSTLLSVTCSAIAAPLNPAYQQQEFEYFFSDLQVKALITQRNFCEAAAQAAASQNIPILYVQFEQNDPAGLFSLSCLENRPSITTGLSSPEDLALIAYTSGSTAKPKIVPLSHRNICVSAANIIKSLQLTPADRCLNVMPLFHIHGSIICTFSTITSGGCLIAAPGFIAPRFLDWMHEQQPTWYSSAPTIHQSILEQVEKRPEAINAHPLRMIRSSAAAMPPQLLLKVEKVWGVPFIEGYGLSETAHLLSSNFLPPFKRKSGSVGIAAGPEVAVMDVESSHLLPPGQIGEVVARGPNVMTGYLRNPEANQKAFTQDGWFRTGDQGYMDEEGYFFITGRIKEIINRGGEKIAPREIDEALLLHPSVKHAVAFGVPDSKLGEEVAAAVVLHQPEVDEKTLKHFLSARLAHFKVPRRILFVDEIPKGPTGKLQRIGLAEKLGLFSLTSEAEQDDSLPASPLEEKIAAIWSKVLHLPQVGRSQSFISLGGDSILVASLVVAFREDFGVSVPLIDLFDALTVAEQANIIQKIIEKP